MAITVNTTQGTSITVSVSGTTQTTFTTTTNSISVTSPTSSTISVLGKGVKGDAGDTGPAGEGFVSGGTENQFIQKNSAAEYDTKWSAYTLPATDGDDGQVLTTNGAATVTFAYPKTIAEDVKNVSGGPLTKGTPVHVTGSVGNLAEVIAADAATNYPAHFVLNEDLADDAEGLAIALGFINNVDVPDASIYTEGQTVYLGESGGWTTTKPTGANAIQNLGIIIKVNTSGNKISGIIMGAGRANDVPNIATGNIWAGNADGVATATSVAYIDIANERVGIGTTSPIYNLDVQGPTNGIIRAYGPSIGRLSLQNSTNHYSTSVQGSNWLFYDESAGACRMLIESSGKVGIGTTTPNYLLDVEGAGAGARVYNTVGATSVYLTTPASQNASLYFGPSTDNNEGGITYRTVDSSMAFTTNTSEAMRIDSSGNVGIGTASPGALLDIKSSTSPVLRISNGGGTSPNPKLEFYRQAGVTANVRYDVANKVFILDNEHASGIIDFKVVNSSKMRIDSSGNVGIGTTSPSEKLHVDGSIRVGDSSDFVYSNRFYAASNGHVYLLANSGYDLKFYAGGTEKMVVDSSGNVGIGTTSPADKLDVRGTARITSPQANDWIVLAQNSAGGAPSGFWDSNGDVHLYLRDSSSNNNVLIRPNSTSWFNGGNVGIGTTSPTSNLHISGITQTGTQIPFRIENDTSNTKFQVNSYSGDYVLQFKNAGNVIRNQLHSNGDSYLNGGNVGIGTTTPSAKLDVAGLANINDGSNNVMISSGNTASITGVENTTLGYRAGINLTSGNKNTAVGKDALYASATATRVDNTAVGHSALFQVTGDGNVGIGRNAGVKSDTGNVAIGNFSLDDNTGSLNVSIGYGAMGAAGSTASSTVAVGYSALTRLTSGAQNTAVGYQALQYVTTANNNTAIGYEALENSDTSYNTSVGAYSLKSNTLGERNTAVGWYALTDTTGSYNASLGMRAGRYGSNSNTAVGYDAASTTTGSNNVAIGRSAGQTNSTGSGNIFIGCQAGYYETGSNKLYIANTDTTTPLIYGEFDNEILNVNGKLKPNSITVDDEGLSAAGDYGPGAEIWYQGTSTPLAGSCYYLDSTGGWTAARANAAGTATGMLAVSAGTDSDVDGMVLRGFVQIGHTLTGSVGDAVYLDTTTAGRFTTIKPTGTGNFVRRVGYLAKGTNVIYFNPSPEWEAL